MAWSNGLAEWIENDTAYLSVVFSWRLPDAYQRASFYASDGYRVRVGGPAVWANRPYQSYLREVAEVGGVTENVGALLHHNALATIASRGCPVGCYFCSVPKMEGLTFTLLPGFTPRPILCDNNLSALPVEYQEHIIEKYQKTGVVLQDANSGFEPLTFDDGTYRRWKQINRGAWRFAFDTTSERPQVETMMRLLRNEPASLKRVYVLIGNEPFAECYARVQQVIAWGGEPHCQPLMALNTLTKHPRVLYDWTEQRLLDMARWANRWLWRKVAFEDYDSSRRKTAEAQLQMPMELAIAS